MHTPEEIMRRLERGLTTIAIEFSRMHQARNETAEPGLTKVSIDTIDVEMQRMHFFLTELKDAEQRGLI